jgi:hypothetical protein
MPFFQAGEANSSGTGEAHASGAKTGSAKTWTRESTHTSAPNPPMRAPPPNPRASAEVARADAAMMKAAQNVAAIFSMALLHVG